MTWHLFKRRLALRLQNLSVRLGGHRAYYDGMPAALELDEVVHELDHAGVPEMVDDWPLTPAQRVRRALKPYVVLGELDTMDLRSAPVRCEACNGTGGDYSGAPTVENGACALCLGAGEV